MVEVERDPFELSELGLADGSAWAIPSGAGELEPFSSSSEILDALGSVCRLRLDAVAAEEATSRPRPFGPPVDNVADAVDRLAEAMARHQLIWRRLAVTGDGDEAPALARAIGRWGLGPAEVLLLAAALAAGSAPNLVPQLSRLSNITVGVAASLLRASPPAQIRAAAFVSPGTPLHDLGLLRPGDSPGGLSRTPLHLSPRVVDLARDTTAVSADVAAWLRPRVPPRAAVDSVRLRDAAHLCDAAVCIGLAPGVDPGELPRAVAAAAAGDRRALFRIGADRLLSPDSLTALIREALLARALLFVETDGADVGGPAWESSAARVLSAGIPLVTDAAGPLPGPTTHVTLEPPPPSERWAMWAELLGGDVAGIDQLVARARIGRAAAERAAAAVSGRPTLARPVSGRATFAALRAQSPRPPGAPLASPAAFVDVAGTASARTDLAAVPDPARPLRLAVIAGPRGSGKRALVASAAASIGLAAFDLDLVAVARAPDRAAILAAATAAAARGWVPVLSGADRATARAPELVGDLEAALAGAAGLVVVATGDLEVTWPALVDAAALVVELGPPSAEDSALLWAGLCPSLSVADAGALGARCLLPGQIREVIARVESGGGPLDRAALESAADRLSRPRPR